MHKRCPGERRGALEPDVQGYAEEGWIPRGMLRPAPGCQAASSHRCWTERCTLLPWNRHPC